MVGINFASFDKAIYVQVSTALFVGIGQRGLVARSSKDGSFHTHVSGILLEYQPYSLLRFNINHRREGLKGLTPELRFILSPSQKGVLLTVEQGDFSTFPQAEEIHAECVSGWNNVRDKLRATCLSVK